MNRSRILIALGILLAIAFATGCKQATSDTPAATTPMPTVTSGGALASAPAITQTKSTSATNAYSAAFQSLGSKLGNAAYLTSNGTGGSNINAPKDSDGIAVTGTMSTSNNVTTVDLNITLTDYTDKLGTKVNGSMTMKGTVVGDGKSPNFDITTNFSETLINTTSSSTVKLTVKMVTDAATSQTTSSGTVIVDNVSYTF